jgi:cytochrome bd-type quinol oxidase subunit 2
VAGTVAVTLLADPHTTDRSARVPVLPAAGTGLLTALACVLLGTAAGALCNRPVLRARGRAVAATLLATLLLLVAGVSPANAAVRGLVAASHDGTLRPPVLPLAACLVLAAAAAAVACHLAPRRR